MGADNINTALTPDIIERFKTAVELGKWPDGRRLTPEQKDTCLQAIIAYEHQHIPEHERTGYVPPKATPCAPKDEDQPLTWKN